MPELTNSPFSIPQGELIKVRVSASNSLGFGIPSSLNTDGVLAQTIPHKPSGAPTRDESTSTTQLVINYSVLTNDLTGGSTIESLHLQWDKGSSGLTWQTLIGEAPYSTSESYTITGNLVAGRVYKFRYRARNIYGWGEYSDQGDILAAAIPSQAPEVVIT